MSAIRAVICDFGGVLTTPLLHAFAAVQDRTGIPTAALGQAMGRQLERDGVHPLFELEKGRITEADFLAALEVELTEILDHVPEMHSFSELYFGALATNDPMIELMAEARDRGFAMALLTNNVREWEPRWRTMLPIDEIFALVVDSAFVGMRKPEPEIYELTVERTREHYSPELADLSAAECVFIDDTEINCDAARELGMTAVHFRANDQALPEIRAALGV